MDKRIVFLTFSNKEYRQSPSKYDNLISLIEKDCNCEIRHKWFEEDPGRTPEQIYNRSLIAIKAADIFIAEISSRSTSIGSQISYALNLKKPVFALLDESTETSKDSLFLKGIQSPYLKIIYYNNLNDLSQSLCNAINTLKPDKLEKFNFVATKSIKESLFSESRKRGMSVSQLLRHIIEEWINNQKQGE